MKSTENGQQKLICLPVASRDCASHSVKLGSDEAKKMTDSSGLKCLELYENFSQHGSLLKMCVASLVSKGAWYSSKCALTWKVSNTKCNRLLFQLAPSTPRTDGTGSGLLRTPDANMERWERSEENLKERYFVKKMPLCLNDQLAMFDKGLLPIPTQCDYKSRGPNSKQDGIDKTVNMLGTPTSRDWKDTGKMENVPENGLLGGQIGKRAGLKLHSDFVSFMMGYPLDWLDI